jgi:redox-sensitive bicupin YhaK (pirin superfamily)
MDGAGVRLYRVFGGMETVGLTDPFLLLDFFGSNDPREYEAGFPWHPHRGIETVTYLMEGKVEHEDSEGNRGVIFPGDLQWMTAGSGIFHQEMPKPIGEEDRGLLQTVMPNTTVKGLQLWINLPANRKMSSPVYRDVRRGHAPKVELDGGVVTVIAGKILGVEGPVKAGMTVDPTYADVNLEPEAEVSLKVKNGYNVLVYVLEGRGRFDPNSKTSIPEGNLILFEDGDEVRVSSDKGVRFILLSGRPLNEPVAWYGPIVMNTEEQILEALSDLRRGTFVREKHPLVE